ncbi:MAG: hypothetical protein QGH60_09085 [Phycisphaerae bacterium]|jgi:hypothetical protein|nr:hypothetical protein [Phycisphaerae bacterium]
MPRLLTIWILVGVAILAALIVLNPQAPHTHAAAAPKASSGMRPAPSGRIAYLPGKELCKLDKEAIDESSGVAAGRANKGVLWTHNDSGDKPRIFAFNHAGSDLASVKITGAAARDWEDICSFAIGRRNFIMIADVGDNASKRSICTLYVVPEPRLNVRQRGRKMSVPVAMTINFRYEDGAHNCESLAVDTTTKTIYLVSKCYGLACKVYALALPARSPKKTLVAKAVASLRIPTATAMDISPDGLRAVICTYGNAYEYIRRPDETWAVGFSRAPRTIRLPLRTQGESICFGPDGQTLYLTSENLPAPLIRIPVKAPATRPASK